MPPSVPPTESTAAISRHTVTTSGPVPDRETRLGAWATQCTQTDRDLVGPGHSEHVDSWMLHDGDGDVGLEGVLRIGCRPVA